MTEIYNLDGRKVEGAFYYPNGEEIEGEDGAQKFIDEYSKAYYIGKPDDTYSPQRSGYVESIIDNLLQDGIQNKKDVLRIIAWRMGAINHEETEQAFKDAMHIDNPSKEDYDKASGEICFIYTECWKDAENWEKESLEKGDSNLSIEGLTLKHWNEKLELTEFVDFIIENKERLYKDAIDNPKKVIREMIDTNPEQMEKIPVITTFLYFLSKGEYPIYDQLVERALNAIVFGIEPGRQFYPWWKFPRKSSPDFADKLMDDQGAYLGLKERIENVFGDYETNYKVNRDIERALWVYGHQFDPLYLPYFGTLEWFQHWYLDINERRYSDDSDVMIYTQPNEDEESYLCWHVKIDLTDTIWEDKLFYEVVTEQGPRNVRTNEYRDVDCWKEGRIFYATADLLALGDAIEIFRQWIEEEIE